MVSEAFDSRAQAAALEDRHPKEILEVAFANFQNIAISFSGAEDIVLLDMASRIKPDFKAFCLDTGRLPPETYDFLERVRERYELALEILFPAADAVERLVNSKGPNSFYKDGHQECCGIRKVAPLRKKLVALDAWVTGQRRDQSPETRTGVPVVQSDAAFSTPGHPLVKFNPLARWSSAQVWDYIHAYDVPYNVLHERGYVSIGCAPCTRAVLPNQHEREGRWWWERADVKECGLHIKRS